VLCHKMLMLSYGQGGYQMTKKQLNAAIKDTESINNHLSKTSRVNLIKTVTVTLLLTMSGYIIYSFYLSGAA